MVVTCFLTVVVREIPGGSNLRVVVCGMTSLSLFTRFKVPPGHWFSAKHLVITWSAEELMALTQMNNLLLWSAGDLQQHIAAPRDPLGPPQRDDA
jgi:hypothetical protein